MRNVFIFCLTALAILFLTRAGNSTARTLRHLVPHKDNTCAQDTGFVAKYSKILGVSLDSCCNHKLIAAVSGWLKVPYMAGGNTKRGTDCSGFVSSIYKEVYGLNLSHSGISMFRQMKQLVKRDEKLQEGDILFFRYRGSRISHVAIYLKDGKFIHAATYGIGVLVNDLHSPYYRRTYFMAGRPFPNVM